MSILDNIWEKCKWSLKGGTNNRWKWTRVIWSHSPPIFFKGTHLSPSFLFLEQSRASRFVFFFVFATFKNVNSFYYVISPLRDAQKNLNLIIHINTSDFLVKRQLTFFFFFFKTGIISPSAAWWKLFSKWRANFQNKSIFEQLLSLHLAGVILSHTYIVKVLHKRSKTSTVGTRAGCLPSWIVTIVFSKDCHKTDFQLQCKFIWPIIYFIFF